MADDERKTLTMPWAVVMAGGLVAAAMLGQTLLSIAVRDRYTVVVADGDIRIVDIQQGKSYAPWYQGVHPAASR